MDEEQIRDLIGAIHKAPLDPLQWEHVVSKLRVVTKSRHPQVVSPTPQHYARFAFLVVVFALFLAPSAAWADRYDCDETNDIELQIRGCTEIINRGRRETKNSRTTAYVNRGNAYFDKGDYDRAIADYDKAIGLNPKSANAYHKRGVAYWEKGDLDAAMADHTKAIKLDPKFAGAYDSRGVVYMDKGDLDAAIANFDKAIALDPKYASAYFNRGILHERKGDLDAAMPDFDKAIQLDREFPEAHLNRGLLYERKGDLEAATADYNDAIVAYDKAIARNPKSAEAYRKRGLAHSQRGNYRLALADTEKWRELVETVETARSGKAGIKTAEALGVVAYDALLAQAFDKALSTAERAIALAPDILWIKANRAHALLFLGRTQEAEELYLAHKGQQIPQLNDKLWEVAVGDDFAQFRKAGLEHLAGPAMAEIAGELGVAAELANAKAASQPSAGDARGSFDYLDKSIYSIRILYNYYIPERTKYFLATGILMQQPNILLTALLRDGEGQDVYENLLYSLAVVCDERLRMRTGDGHCTPFKVSKIDKARNLVLLETEKPLIGAPAKFNANDPEVDARVRAYGLPQEALEAGIPTITSGAVAKLNIGVEGHTILHQAPLTEGHYGGPLVNACGEVIGLNLQPQEQRKSVNSLSEALGTKELQTFAELNGINLDVVDTKCAPQPGPEVPDHARRR